MHNDHAELERFKTEINLSEFAASRGYMLDLRESGKNADKRHTAVMRHANGDKIIIAQEGQHWVYFSARDGSDNGSIIDFVQRRDGCRLGQARQTLRRWMGTPPPPINPTHYVPKLAAITRDRAAIMRQFSRLQPITDHPALAERGITRALLDTPRFAGMVLRDDHGNACFPHFDSNGVSGWEVKNRGFTGFAKDGAKGLWFSRTKPADLRLVIAESAIDALSYAALFPDPNARYFSTGGSLSTAQTALIARAFEKMPGPAVIVLATDNDPAGHALAATLQSLAPSNAEIQRHLPTIGKDWNDQLKTQLLTQTPDPKGAAAMTDTPRAAVELHPADWQAGYDAGLAGQQTPPPRGVDGVAWYAGLIEGKADKGKPPEERKPQTRQRTPAAIPSKTL